MEIPVRICIWWMRTEIMYSEGGRDYCVC